jgi:hypothetical protein
MEKKLRDRIADFLKGINKSEYPNIYRAINSTEIGYKNIEDEIIRMFINESMSIGATLYHIERQ